MRQPEKSWRWLRTKVAKSRRRKKTIPIPFPMRPRPWRSICSSKRSTFPPSRTWQPKTMDVRLKNTILVNGFVIFRFIFNRLIVSLIVSTTASNVLVSKAKHNCDWNIIPVVIVLFLIWTVKLTIYNYLQFSNRWANPTSDLSTICWTRVWSWPFRT